MREEDQAENSGKESERADNCDVKERRAARLPTRRLSGLARNLATVWVLVAARACGVKGEEYPR